MRIIIAPDSFKETLTALEVANAIEKGMKKVLKKSEFIKIPMADGGEGTVQSLVDATGGSIIKTKVSDPLNRQIDSHFGILGDKKTAVIEMASASGLSLIKEEEKNPLKTTTFGTGELIKKAIDKGVKKIIIGIGGSATVDAGSGMAQALGVRLVDKKNKDLKLGGGYLKNLRHIDLKNIDSRIKNIEFIVACDVNNPLTGKNGAAKVYGPQKGATKDMVVELEKSLIRFEEVVKNDLDIDITDIPGTGAAGGLGAGFLVFCNAVLKSGIDIVSEITELEKYIKKSNLVITGEGQINYQTVFGKTLSGVGKRAKRYNVPVIAINGSIGKGAEVVYKCGIDAYFSTLKSCPCNIKEEAYDMLVECSEQVARTIKLRKDL